jgi:hypothetical protein
MKNSTHKWMEFLGMGNLGPPLGIRGNGEWERSYQCPKPVAQSGGATILLHPPGECQQIQLLCDGLTLPWLNKCRYAYLLEKPGDS